jgi:hypothetical protein
MNSVHILTAASDRFLNFSQKLSLEVLQYSGIECKIVKLDNTCEGDWQTNNFFNACYNKIVNIISEIESLENNDIFIFLDGDIAVFGDIVSTMIDELDDRNILFQRDNDKYCTGMFVCKVCPLIKDFFKLIKVKLVKNKRYYMKKECEQTTINDFLPVSKLKYGFLSDKFTTYGNIGGNWSQQTPPFDLDKSVLAFHANWTIGLENKTALLEYVRTHMTENGCDMVST